MSVKAVIRAGLALLAALVMFLLLEEGPRRSGGNYTPKFGPVAELRGASRHCQDAEMLPGDTGALRLLVGTYGRPTPELSVRAALPDGKVVTSGRLPPGRRQGELVIPVDTVQRTTAGVEVCLGSGPGRRTVLYGRGDRVSLDWLRPGSESRLAMLPTIAHRFGLAKPNPFGSWLLAVVALILAAACFIALRLTVRELQR